jgi:hypothetical protein
LEEADIMSGPYHEASKLFIGYANAAMLLENELESHINNNAGVHLCSADIRTLIEGLRKSYDVLVTIASKYPSIEHEGLNGASAVRKRIEAIRKRPYSTVH